MSVKFYEVVEEIKCLKLEDKLYLKEMFDKIIIEEKRKLIKKNADKSLKEYEEGKIEFKTVKELKKKMNER